MSSEAGPISPAQFASAIEDLPVENLYSKAFEIQNSVAHLQRSNRELEEYSDSVSGDIDCAAAVKENQEVIGRMKDRIDLIKKEVERRGQKWHEGEVNGAPKEEVAAGGSLNDEELRRRMEERMTGDGGDKDEDEEGVHL